MPSGIASKQNYNNQHTHSDGPAFNTRSRTAQHHSSNDPTLQTDATAQSSLKQETLHQNPCQ